MKHLKSFFESRIEHLYQPCGISCGNTVLKMLLNFYGICPDTSIEELIRICGTDNKTGTTDKKLKVGLEYANIPHEQNTVIGEDSITDLKSRLGNELFLMRTLTKGIPHWILVYHYDGSMWDVMDPWLGEIQYNDQEILDIWEPRNYDGFYVPRTLPQLERFNFFNKKEKYPISLIGKEDIDDVLELADKVFWDSGMDNKLYIGSNADWSISVKMVDSDRIIGFYIFNKEGLPFSNDKFSGKAVQGVALGIDEEYKGKGLGKKLIQYPYENLGNQFDYIWGMQLKSLKNIDDWLKRREIVADMGGMYITAGLLN